MCGVGCPSRRRPPPTQQQINQSTASSRRHLQYWPTVNNCQREILPEPHTITPEYSHLAANSQTEQRKWTWPRLDCCPKANSQTALLLAPPTSAHSFLWPGACCFFIIMYSDVSVRSMNHAHHPFSLADFFYVASFYSLLGIGSSSCTLRWRCCFPLEYLD